MGRLLFCFVALGSAVFVAPLQAEVLILTTGGHLEGQLLNPDESPRKTYQFKMASGAEVTLDAEQVREYKADRPEVAEYERIKDKYPDTVEGQFALALWCRDHSLPALRVKHLQRVLQLNPDHYEARHMLDYKKVDGQWMTIEEEKTKEGYVRDKKGDWKLPQVIEMEEKRDKQQAAEREWYGKINRWRGWLNGDRQKQGRDALVSITDPNAVSALARKLVGVETAVPADASIDARLIYVEALSHIALSAANPQDAGPARSALAMAALQDNEESVRMACLDELVKQKEDPMTVAFFIKQLRNKTNHMVNRAAVALERMKDPTAIGPLIDALITSHKRVIDPGSNGQTSTSFGTHGTPGGGISMNRQPKVVIDHIENQAVLDALVSLTHQTFGFDVAAWHRWFVGTQLKSPGGVDVRRDK